ncbi:MAG TPA: type II secretion system protein [Pirellulaceae bacterium]|nr:type II secretion system protein [Pirellulaceae bacterium]
MRRRGFTLVEILVVLAIIAMLVALTATASMWAVNAARRAAISVEVGQLRDAVEAYKQAKGDYPPNFRDYQAFIRHVRTCYPKCDVNHLDTFVGAVWPGYSLSSPPPANTMPQLDEGESLVFWLQGTRNDPLRPFGGSAELVKYYSFDSRFLLDSDGDGQVSFRARYAKDTFYLYMDSRSYDELTAVSGAAFVNNPAHAEGVTANGTRPYFTDAASDALPGTNYVNPTTFQIVCAGQDGEFGADTSPPTQKQFPGFRNGTSADRDNVTSFSEGKTLDDNIPD